MSCLDGHCGELVINENLITDETRSIIARVSPDKKCIVEKYSYIFQQYIFCQDLLLQL